MGIAVQQPPAQPVVIQQQQQQQQQQQYIPVSTSANDLQNNNDSQSESLSYVDQSPYSSNVQNNFVSNSDFGFGIGEKHAVPVFTGGLRYTPGWNDNQVEMHVGFIIPVGGKGAKISIERQRARIDSIKLTNDLKTYSACANILNANLNIRYDMLEDDNPLWNCQTLLASNQIILPPPPVPSVSEFREAWEAEKRKNAIMEAKLKKLMLLLEREGENPFTNGG